MLYPVGNTGNARALLSFVSREHTQDRGDIEAQKQLLTRVFAGGGWRVPNLLEYVRLSQRRPPGSTGGYAPRTRRGIWLRNQCHIQGVIYGLCVVLEEGPG